jgi:adenylate cyclase
MSKPSTSATKTRASKAGGSHAAPGAVWACALVMGFLLLAGGVFRKLDLSLYDTLLALRVRHFPLALNAQIIHADLNDSSEFSLGGDLESRKAFADFLSVLASCNARVTFDFIFRSPALMDREFAEAARQAGLCIMAAAPVEEEYANFAYDSLSPEEKALLNANVWHIKEMGENTIPRAKTFILSEYEISSAATALAHIGVIPDHDGIYRRTPLFYRWGDGLVPAISLAVAVWEMGINPEEIEFYPGRALVLPLPGEAPVRIPVDESCSALIPFTTVWADNKYRVSFDLIAKAAENSEIYSGLFSELSNAMIMAADTTTGKRDFGITPAETIYPLSGIHTAVLSGIIEEYFYREWPFYARAAALIILIVMSFLLLRIKEDRRYSFICLTLFLAFTAWTVPAWFFLRISPWYAACAGFLFLFWFSNFAYRLFRRYREQLLLQHALSRYFPRSLAERITTEGRTELVPAYKELTILFSDIAGFTKWSSDKDPDLVHAFLSDYLETMAGIIFEHGGTVDKFMGDGILAFFGDPFDMPDHTRRAVDAAVAMQKKIRELAASWALKAAIDLKVRIGINTGWVIVGNLGTKTRIEYTVIGADVNLGQRMEANAPPGGILVTAAVKEKVKDKFSFSQAREIQVKGYEKPVKTYEVAFTV